jgi:hypothetical protein
MLTCAGYVLQKHTNPYQSTKGESCMTDQERNDKPKKTGKISLFFTILCIVFLVLKFTGLLDPVVDFFKK